MRPIYKGFLLAVALLCASTLSIAQSPAPCNYTLFKYPGTTIIDTTARGINRWGTIVGWAQDQANGVWGFTRYADGSFKRFKVFGSGSTQFFRRNANGATVGFYVDGTNLHDHGLLLVGSTLTTIDYPGAANTVLTGINQWGTMVGYYIDSSGHYKGFKRWSNGSFQPVQFPNATDTMPMDINDSGIIVGSVGAGGPINVRGFVLANGKYTYVDDPFVAVGSTVLTDINASGMIVGESFDSNGTAKGFRLKNGTFENLIVPGSIESDASGINDSGVIVGSATISGAGNQSYIAQCQ